MVPDSRDLYYSYPKVPFAIIYGGRGDQLEYLIDFTSDELERDDLDLAVLEDNKLDINLETITDNDYLNIEVEVTSLTNLGQRYITVHVVIV